MKNTIDGYEWCPYCEGEIKFSVPEDTWIIPCEVCGRPLLLCDKCYSLNGPDGRNCGGCVHERTLKRKMKIWERSQIGRIVKWNDPDGGICSGYCKVVGFRDEAFVLKHLLFDESGMREGGIVESFGSEIEFLDEDKQVRLLVSLFGRFSKWKV